MYYLLFSGNCSKRTKKALDSIPYGEITSEYSFWQGKYEPRWYFEREYLIKCDSFQEMWEIAKYLKANASGEVTRNHQLVANPLKENIPYTRPIAFQQQETPTNLVREYDYSAGCIREIGKTIIDNRSDLAAVLDGDLELLAIARELRS